MNGGGCYGIGSKGEGDEKLLLKRLKGVVTMNAITRYKSYLLLT